MAETLPHADLIAYPLQPMGEASDTLRFGDFTLDLADRRLLRDGERVDLGSRYFDALVLLCAHPDTLVTKDRFMEEVWKGIPVTDEALTQCIRTLRRALGDDAAKPVFIETVPKHGYRFVAPVKRVGPDESEPPEVDKPPLARAAAARIAGATTLGGLGAGLVGGLYYGILGTDGGPAALLAVVLLTGSLALLGGAGIGTGMALASLWRGPDRFAVFFGGAGGGALVGALGSAIASQSLRSLTGVDPPPVTGMLEGLALGGAGALSFVVAKRCGLGLPVAALLAAAIGAIVSNAVHRAGGRFYVDTLQVLESLFPQSDLSTGFLSGDPGVWMSVTFEGAFFTCAIVLANLFVCRQRS